MTEEVSGEPCVIQADESDVSLEVPREVHATITSKTYTDTSKFQQHISDNECLVSPICEFSLDAEQSQSNEGWYTAKIPHDIKNVKKAENHIRVRQGDISQNLDVPMVEIKRKRRNSGPLARFLRKSKKFGDTDACYYIDENYVTVETRKLGVIIVTVEGLNCCSSTASIFLFGSLRCFSDKKSLAKFKVYFSGSHKRIKDYKSVSKLYSVHKASLREFFVNSSQEYTF